MADFVKPEQVLLDVTCETKDAALEMLSKKAAELGIAESEEAAKAAFDAREEEGTTGMMDGFAVPHAKSAAIKRAAVIVQRFASPVTDWEAIDDSPITLAIALLVPDGEAGSTHITLLSQVARALMDTEFRAAIREASDPAAVADLINGRLDA